LNHTSYRSKREEKKITAPGKPPAGNTRGVSTNVTRPAEKVEVKPVPKPEPPKPTEAPKPKLAPEPAKPQTVLETPCIGQLQTPA